MENINQKQQKKIQRLAEVVQSGNIGMLKAFDELEEKFDETVAEIKDATPDLKQILETIKGKDGEDGEDGKDYVLTEQDKKDIAGSITVPVVTKVIEKTEVIREKPMVTNNIVEVLKYEDAYQIADKLNETEGIIDHKVIKGFHDALDIKMSEGISKGISRSGGMSGMNVYVAGSKKGIVKAINFAGMTYSKVNGLDTVTGNTTATGMESYNTVDQTVNYEKLSMAWGLITANQFGISTSGGGTQTTARGILIRSAGTVGGVASANLTVDANDTHQVAVNRNSGVAGKTYFGITGTAAQSSGSVTFQSIEPTITQTSTAGYTALHINPTESTTGSGTKNLILAQVGGLTKFAVSNTGALTLADPISPANGGFGISNAKTDIATTGTINDQAVATGWLNFTGSASVSITGFVAQAAGTEILITNNTTSTVTLATENASSSAANRIASSITQILQAKGSLRLKYNITTARWNLVQPSIVTYTSPLSLNTSNAVSMTAATTSVNGYVTTASQSFAGLKEFTGNLHATTIGDDTNLASVQLTLRKLILSDGTTVSIDWQQHDLMDSTGNVRVNWSNSGNGALYVDGGSSTAKIANGGYCIDGTGVISTNSSPYSASLCNGQAGYFSNGSQIVYIGDGTYAINVTSGDSYFDGKIIANNIIRLKGYIVSNLPTGTTGDRAYVTDASSPTYGSTASGGGAVTIPVFFDGSNWITA